MTAAIAAGALAVFLFAKNPLFDRIFSMPSDPDVSLEGVRLGPKPNQYLVLPKGWGVEKPHRESPVFEMPVAELERRFREIVAAAPRTAWLSGSTLVTRSRLWRFPDLVTVAFVPLGDSSSTLAVYSRALYGHSDLGKNKKRIDAWLAALSLEHGR